jgi:hypothetical protein
MGALKKGNARIAEADFYAAVRTLRTCTFELLEKVTRDGMAAGDPGVVARLQAAANELGAVERLMGPSPVVARTPAGEPEGPPLSGDAATVLALAQTTVPLASSTIDQAERWVRTLRLHGRVGAALAEVGVSAYQLPTIADVPASGASTGRADDAVAAVAEMAREFASRHGARTLDTVHILFAVFAVYGTRLDRALYAHGTTREELLDHLVTEVPLAS